MSALMIRDQRRNLSVMPRELHFDRTHDDGLVVHAQHKDHNGNLIASITTIITAADADALAAFIRRED